MIKQNKTSIIEGEWKDIRVRKQTAKSLQYLKLNLDMLTYDDVINYLLNKEGVGC